MNTSNESELHKTLDSSRTSTELYHLMKTLAKKNPVYKISFTTPGETENDDEELHTVENLSVPVVSVDDTVDLTSAEQITADIISLVLNDCMESDLEDEGCKSVEIQDLCSVFDLNDGSIGNDDMENSTGDVKMTADTEEEEIEAAVSNKDYGKPVIEFVKKIINAPVRSSARLAVKRSIKTFDEENRKTYVKADFKEEAIEDKKPAGKKTKKNVVFREDLNWIFSHEDDYMIEARKDDHLEKSFSSYDDDFSEDFNSQAVCQENQDTVFASDYVIMESSTEVNITDANQADIEGLKEILKVNESGPGQRRSARLAEKVGGKGKRLREEQDEGNKKKPWNYGARVGRTP